MASIVTLAQNNTALVAAAFRPQECAYCRSAIASGERWVREKIYAPFTENTSSYQRYHADLFDGENLSCWEKHQVQQDTARAAKPAA